jgi:hypothetical protein
MNLVVGSMPALHRAVLADGKDVFSPISTPLLNGNRHCRVQSRSRQGAENSPLRVERQTKVSGGGTSTRNPHRHRDGRIDLPCSALRALGTGLLA